MYVYGKRSLQNVYRQKTDNRNPYISPVYVSYHFHDKKTE